MLFREEKYTFPLTYEGIDSAAEVIRSFGQKKSRSSAGSEKADLRASITAEELLLIWMDNGLSGDFELIVSGKGHKNLIDLSIPGECCDPVRVTEQNDSFILSSIMKSVPERPVFRYARGTNRIRITHSTRKRNPIIQLLQFIALGIVLGLLIKHCLPAGVSAAVESVLLEPLYDIFFVALKCIAGPLIFLSVIWGIYGIGDVSVLNKVGKALIKRFLGLLYFFVILATVLFPVFNTSMKDMSVNVSEFSDLLPLILGFIPSDIFSPFIDGNTVQIILLGVVGGIAFLSLGKRVSHTSVIVEELNILVQFIMKCLSSVIPYFIFIVVLKLILSDSLGLVLPILKFVFIFLGCAVFAMLLVTVVISLKYKVSFARLVKKSIPTFLISITTASSAAAFSTNVKTCEKEFGIDGSLTGFGIPLGMVMLDVGNSLFYLLICFHFSGLYSVDCSVVWIITCVLICPVMAIATPPVPGGSVIAYTVLFTQMGIPSEAVAIVLSIDIIFDFVKTAVNMYILPMVLIDTADTLKILDIDKLRS